MLYPEILKAAKKLDNDSFLFAKDAENMKPKEAKAFNAIYNDMEEQVRGMLKAYEILTGIKYYPCDLLDMEF